MSEIPLLYKDRRKEGETPLRQCQLVQLHLLYVFDAVCRKHNIPYVLDAGTLLGSVRHGGFIPWDDDLDVAMMRKDYDRFIKIAKAELPKDVLLVSPKDVPERVIGFSKLRDAYSFYAELGLGISLRRPNGCFIDVFPMVKLPKQGRAGMTLLRICKWSYHYGRAFRCSGVRGWPYAFCGAWIALLLYLVHYLLRLYFYMDSLIRPLRDVYYDFTVPFMSKRRVDEYFPYGEMRFEDGVFPVPRKPEAVLSGIYGNWRTPVPREQQRGGHGRLILPFQSVQTGRSMLYPGCSTCV